MASYRGKYTPLFHHLAQLDDQRWPATFEEVEAVLGFPLPPSARKYQAWWENEDANHSQARAWRAAGWRTSAVDLAAGRLVFARGPSDSTGARLVPAVPRASHPRRAKTAGGGEAVYATSGTDTLTLGGQSFRHVARISPEAGPDGKPLEDVPRRRYYAAASTPLNRHGKGPFCRFSVAGLPAAPGVYALTVAQQLAYVGIATKSLRERWGPRGYAEIQPRNCFRRPTHQLQGEPRHPVGGPTPTGHQSVDVRNCDPPPTREAANRRVGTALERATMSMGGK